MAVLSREAATLKCFMCGTVCGHLVDRIVRLAAGVQPAETLSRIRCPRCRGSVYLDRELDLTHLQN